MKEAAKLVRRAATELMPVNGHGQCPPSPATPPSHSHPRNRCRTKPPTTTRPEFQPPDPPPTRIRLDLDELEHSAGPRAPAKRARRRRAPKNSTAGDGTRRPQNTRRQLLHLQGAAGRTSTNFYHMYRPESGIPLPPPPERPAEGRNSTIRRRARLHRVRGW